MKKPTLLFLLFPAFVQCENLDSLAQKFEGAKVLGVYQVTSNPIEPNQQSRLKSYLHSYEISKSISLRSGVKKQLVRALMDPENCSQNDVKRCPFQGYYALVLDNSITLIISTAPCSKLLIFTKEDEEGESYDLNPQNGIETVLNKVRVK